MEQIKREDLFVKDGKVYQLKKRCGFWREKKIADLRNARSIFAGNGVKLLWVHLPKGRFQYAYLVAAIGSTTDVWLTNTIETTPQEAKILLDDATEVIFRLENPERIVYYYQLSQTA